MSTNQHILPPGLAHIADGRDVLSTPEAAYVLNRKPQTLRVWASTEAGAVRPLRINGRLAWRVADLAAVLNGQEVAHA